MQPPVIDIHDIDNGVDRKQLALLKQRFLTLNTHRYERTCAALLERQQQFLALLPLLFHVNHPMLPGYISHQVPCGICHFTPDKEVLRLAKIWARSFHFTRDLAVTKPAIDAIFVMGSIGTIGQSDGSDLDIWICHRENLAPAETAELEQKCRRVQQWAEQSLRLETHFFLMTENSFQTQKTELSSEGSGSAQHYLLLDEFYRTALWLAGKVPLWWFIPASQENNYADYRDILLGRRFIRAQDVIDFGGIPTIPTNEFIGASIWQLYKGIEAPYKSALKLLLLETYASNLADDSLAHINEPLALTFKRALYQAEPDASLLDPYVMIYQRLESYLQHKGQLQRLELVRRCFYFKVDKPLTQHRSRTQKSWQRLLLESLVEQWNWPQHHLHLLDHRLEWKAPHVIAERRLLVNELTNSYRLLIDINKNSFAEAVIDKDELMILGRKLHAAFERKAGKIEWINPGISRDLHEPALCAVHDTEDDGPRWQLYTGTRQELTMRLTPAEPLKRASNLVELLFWSWCNGILTQDTRLELVSDTLQFNNIQKQQLLQTLHQWLPLPPAPIAHECFKETTRTLRLLLLFNIGVEPQAELHKKGLQLLSSQRDALGYSGLKENLVLSVDIVQINNWGEVVCRHYGTDALVNALLHYLRMLPPGRGLPLPELTIRCFSVNQGSTIAQRLEELWRDIIACYYSGTRSPHSRYILEVGDHYLLLQFLQQQPRISRYNSYTELLEKLANAQIDYSPIVIDRYALRDQALKLFCAAVTLPGIYVFFQAPPTGGTTALVSIFDEKGSLFTRTMPYYNQQTLLRPLHHFIHTVLRRQEATHESSASTTGAEFSYDPVQYFEVMGNVRQQQGYLEPRQVNADIRRLPFIDIQVIAEPDGEGHIDFNIFCDQQEFSTRAHGSQLYNAVARYILQRRSNGEKYPCYITDLDLSLCRMEIAPQTGLQLSHYLQTKANIEHQLNQALKAL